MTWVAWFAIFGTVFCVIVNLGILVLFLKWHRLHDKQINHVFDLYFALNQKMDMLRKDILDQ